MILRRIDIEALREETDAMKRKVLLEQGEEKLSNELTVDESMAEKDKRKVIQESKRQLEEPQREIVAAQNRSNYARAGEWCIS